MPLRIVDEKGLGYTCRIFDAETGEDLTSRLHVSAADIHLAAGEVPTSASLTIYAPKVEITVAEAQVRQACPYCGHTREYTLSGAHDLETATGQTGEREDEQSSGDRNE